ncbi:hypothetical protein D6D01_05415 [Aureobasidium pullulans]|uniref:Uncharacterized protein n=1 Tax=Aureobasidium pullulans TaxID=5580 RepID=A0A4S9L616_AURPU|nr:hypothetical protein D6D01_05415 [Aureobasidium pullulans]
MDQNALLQVLYDQGLIQEQRITELENRLAGQHDKLVKVFILSAGTFVMLLIPFVVALHNRRRFPKTGKVIAMTPAGLRFSKDMEEAGKEIEKRLNTLGEKMEKSARARRDERLKKYKDCDDQVEVETMSSDSDTTTSGSTIYTPSASNSSFSEEAFTTSTISSSQIQVLEKLASTHNPGVRNTGIVPPDDKALSYNDTFLPLSYHNHFDISSPLNTFTPTHPRPRNFGKLESAQQRAWHRRNVQEKIAQAEKEQKRMEEAMRCSKMNLHEGSNSNTAFEPKSPSNGATGHRVLSHGKERHKLPDSKDERVDDMIAELNRELERTGDARLDADRSEVDKVILEGLRMGPYKE